MSETKEKTFDIDKFYEKEIERMKVLGFYGDIPIYSLYKMIMRHYDKEFVKAHYIGSISFSLDGKELVINWKPRFESMRLSDEEYAKEFTVELKKIRKPDYSAEALSEKIDKSQKEVTEIAEKYGLNYSQAIELWVEMNNQYKKSREK